MEGFHLTVDKIGILLQVRLKKDEYKPLWDARAALIAKDPQKQKTWEHYPTYPTAKDRGVVDYAKNVNAQLVAYRNKLSCFGRPAVIEAAEEMPAHLWWDQHGSTTPDLQSFARIVLSQPASASICERINSEFAFIKDRRRNGLGHEKANMLVGLFHNLRLMARMSKTAYTEPAVGWLEDTDTKAGIKKWGIANYK